MSTFYYQQPRIREKAAVPGVPPQRRVMEGVEAVVVGDGDVGAGLQQNGQHVVSLLADGVVERRVSLRVLQRAQRAKSGTENLLAGC